MMWPNCQPFSLSNIAGSGAIPHSSRMIDLVFGLAAPPVFTWLPSWGLFVECQISGRGVKIFCEVLAGLDTAPTPDTSYNTHFDVMALMSWYLAQ